MLEIAGIDHIVLRTDNLQKMIGFYTNVLGCKLERASSPEIGLTQLRAGNALIDLVAVDSRLGKMGGGAPTKTENNLDHYCLQVKAIPEVELLAHLAAHNIEAGELTSRYGAQGFGNSVYIHDPDGNVVELRNQV